MNKLVGIYYILSVLPIWAIWPIVLLGTTGMVVLLRWIFEGKPYSIAYSANGGMFVLLNFVLLASGIVRRGGTIPLWLQNSNTHWLILVLAFVVMVIFTVVLGNKLRSARLGDRYNDIVISPVVIYLLATIVPLLYYNATRVEAFVFALLIWGQKEFFFYDIKTGRIDQRREMERRRIFNHH